MPLYRAKHEYIQHYLYILFPTSCNGNPPVTVVQGREKLGDVECAGRRVKASLLGIGDERSQNDPCVNGGVLANATTLSRMEQVVSRRVKLHAVSDDLGE